MTNKTILINTTRYKNNRIITNADCTIIDPNTQMQVRIDKLIYNRIEIRVENAYFNKTFADDSYVITTNEDEDRAMELSVILQDLVSEEQSIRNRILMQNEPTNPPTLNPDYTHYKPPSVAVVPIIDVPSPVLIEVAYTFHTWSRPLLIVDHQTQHGVKLRAVDDYLWVRRYE